MAQVTPTKVEADTTTPAPGRRRDVHLGRAVRWGVIGGGTAILISAIGMVEDFQARQIVRPLVTLGQLALFLVPLIYGYLAGRPPPRLEGMAAPRRGPRNVLAGLIAGAASGVVLSLFVLLAGAVNLRQVFINITPALIQTLTFERGAAGGIPLILVSFALVGALGGLFHLIPQQWRRALVSGLAWVFAFGLLRDLLVTVFQGIKLSVVATWLFASGSGLSIRGMLIVLVVAFAASAVLEPGRKRLRLRLDSLDDRTRRTYGLGGLVAMVAVLGAMPLVVGTFFTNVLDVVGIFLIMALGLNIVVGFAGLLDLGYVAFFAVGAYGIAVLSSPSSPRWNPELGFWGALPIIILAATFAGIIVGTPVLRMRGDYLAIVTLGFGEIARILFLSDWLKPVFGGAQGITRIPDLTVGPLVLRGATELFYPILGFILLAAYVSWALQDSRIGRAWMAMREDESVAEALGINIVTTKLSAFIVGAVLASFGGALFGMWVGSVFPHSFNIIISIVVLVIIIVGGMGSIPGVAVGALVLVGVPELLREFEEYRFLLYGGLLIFMMLQKPEGLLPSRRRAQELHQEEMMQDAWLAREEAERQTEAAPSTPERDPDAGLT